MNTSLLALESPLFHAINAYLIGFPKALEYSKELPPPNPREHADTIYGGLEHLAMAALKNDPKLKSKFPRLFCAGINVREKIRGFSLSEAFKAVGKGPFDGDSRTLRQFERKASKGDTMAKKWLADLNEINKVISSIQRGYLLALMVAANLNKRLGQLPLKATVRKALLVQFDDHARLSDEELSGTEASGDTDAVLEIQKLRFAGVKNPLSFNSIVGSVDQMDAFILNYWLHPDLSLCFFSAARQNEILELFFTSGPNEERSPDMFRKRIQRLKLVSFNGPKLDDLHFTGDGVRVGYKHVVKSGVRKNKGR